MTGLLLLAALMTLAGAGLLYAAWLGRMWNGAVAVAGGWLILLMALAPWVQALGVEFGVVVGLLAPSLAAWVWVTWQGRQRGEPARSDQRPWQTGRWPGAGAAGRQVVRFMVVVPAAGLAATWITITMGSLLPWSEMSRLAAIVILMPVVWGLLAAWLVSATRWQRPVLFTAAAGAASALALYGGLL